VRLRESDGAPNDLARALVVVEHVEAVPAGWMIHHVQHCIAGQRFLHEQIDRIVDHPLILARARDEDRQAGALGPDLLGAAPDLDEVRDILDHICRDDQRAAEVISRLRAFLKRDPTERRELDLNAMVGEVFRFLSVQALTHDVELVTEPSSGEIRVKADKIQLQQAILNLVVNGIDAVAHLPDKRRRVVGRTSLADGNVALVSVTDTGDGILAEKVTEIFKPFFTTKAQGMGIGLSIAHTIIEAHGGRIWAENAPEGGAVFHVSLPLAAAR